MNDREERVTEQELNDYFRVLRTTNPAPADLWGQVSVRIAGSAQPSSSLLSWPLPAGRRAAVVSAVLALVAVFAISPWSGGNGTSPATELLQRAQAAALDAQLVESVYSRIRVEDLVYENRTQPAGTPVVSQMMSQEIWWSGPTLWRFESSMEYLRDGAPIEPEPGWLKGGVTVANGTDVWTFTDVEPGETAAPEDLNHPQTRVRHLNEYDEIDPGSLFAFPASFLTGQEHLGLSNTLGLLEECFESNLDGTDEVAGRETHVVRLVPHGIGDRIMGVIDAGGCMAIIRPEATPTGDRIAEQEVTLWIDTEYFFILKMEQMVWSTLDEGEPIISISRSEVTELELNGAIPAEHFEFTPPPEVPIVDDR
jgi:hypothetical protein